MDKQIVLDLSLHGKALEQHAFDKEQVSIGSHPTADLLLHDPNVSRLHARILNCESRFMLEDCGSSSGTFVNGVSKRRSWLAPGDEIKIGKYCLAVDIFDPVESYASCSDELFHSWRAPHDVSEDEGELLVLKASSEGAERLLTIVFD